MVRTASEGPKTPGPRALRRQAKPSTVSGLAWPIAVDLADDGPPLVRKTCGSTSQMTMSTISAMVSDGSPKKWSEHGGGSVRDFK